MPPFIAIVKKYELMWDGHLDRIMIAKNHIVLSPPDAPPTYAAQCRIGPREIGKRHASSVAKPAAREWISAIIFVSNNDGCLRFSMDYRWLNAVSVKVNYPIACMNECIDSLGKAQMFSTLGENSEHWQIKLVNKNVTNAAFFPRNGLENYSFVPPGIKNAFKTFQPATETMLSLVNWQHAITYVDEIIIFSKTPEQYLRHIEEM